MRNDLETGCLSRLVFGHLTSFFGRLCDAFDRFPQTGHHMAEAMDYCGGAGCRRQLPRAALPEFLEPVSARLHLYGDPSVYCYHALVFPASGLPRCFQHYHRPVRRLHRHGQLHAGGNVPTESSVLRILFLRCAHHFLFPDVLHPAAVWRYLSANASPAQLQLGGSLP